MNTRFTFDHSTDADRSLLRREGLARPVSPVPARRVDSAVLFRGEHEIGIEHHGALYRLKITRQGKLILNK
ncbi:Hemin uptake protein hemP [Mesorhizobium australicum]|uniref:Hemin uptake protein hemP n=1 Tax=Mesorhizobium australicum TaxID=536018 RepID=A0A1X7PAC8_9HYPH|nr:Hemin uptake protein hemP [Mesorhizobium australicum]